jgi:hypothetical protein
LFWARFFGRVRIAEVPLRRVTAAGARGAHERTIVV